ncbi:hypothetical protein ABH923_003199 [Leifsonia sp. EB41]|uniref:hypothetical protein n=1 Tax=Leifsonia sp. EB41 TaxID=3156260 RepID=UPI0035150498
MTPTARWFHLVGAGTLILVCGFVLWAAEPPVLRFAAAAVGAIAVAWMLAVFVAGARSG